MTPHHALGLPVALWWGDIEDPSFGLSGLKTCGSSGN